MTIATCEIAAILLLAACSSEPAAKQAALDPSTALIIDVRTPQEFGAGHIDGAHNIPYGEIGERIGEVTAQKDRQIVLYCRTGRRSGIAHKRLQELGYTRVRNAGGYEDLRQEIEQAAARGDSAIAPSTTTPGENHVDR